MKLFVTLSIAVLLVGAPVAHAITAADVELLISIGAIPPEKAAAARATFSTGTLTSTAVTPKTATHTTAAVAGGTCIELPRNLLFGTTDTSVTLLQQFLRTQGHLTSNENTTYFGALTRDAVISFQLAHGLITSRTQLGAGSVGPTTIAKIKSLTCATPAATVVSKGQAKIDSVSTYANELRGELKYRYTVSITPAEDISLWRVRLVCDADQISTNRRDLTDCGESVEFEVGSSGKKTFSIQYKNSSRANQMVGVIAEALDEQGRVIDVAERIDYVAAPGIRDLAPKPGEGGYRVTFISSTSTPHTFGNDNDGNGTPRCNPADKTRVALWSQGPTREQWWGDTPQSIDVYSLSPELLSAIASRIEIVEPNNRTIAQIVDAYKATHTFPTLDYVRLMKSLGEQYFKKNKGWVPIDETEASLERKRKEIQKEVSGIPTYLTTREQIASNDSIVALGELYVPTRGNPNYYASSFKWVWHGREFGTDLQKYRIYNGSIVTNAVTSCETLSNSSYDIILFKK